MPVMGKTTEDRPDKRVLVGAFAVKPFTAIKSNFIVSPPSPQSRSPSPFLRCVRLCPIDSCLLETLSENERIAPIFYGQNNCSWTFSHPSTHFGRTPQA